jgi:hypothetical protein
LIKKLWRQDGYVGFDDFPRKKLERIYDSKAFECDDWRTIIRKQFPNILGNEEMRKTVEYNRRLGKKGR